MKRQITNSISENLTDSDLDLWIRRFSTIFYNIHCNQVRKDEKKKSKNKKKKKKERKKTMKNKWKR